jgi:hypothetical protein
MYGKYDVTLYTVLRNEKNRSLKNRDGKKSAWTNSINDSDG